jgi:hypothetical protein
MKIRSGAVARFQALFQDMHSPHFAQKNLVLRFLTNLTEHISFIVFTKTLDPGTSHTVFGGSF